jgi:ABC-type polysaccharide/polyol phosphate export permease
MTAATGTLPELSGPPPEPPTEPPPGTRYRRRLTMRSAMVELWRARGLIRTLVERDLRIRYKQTVLGFAWAVITPVMLMLVFTIFVQQAAHFATGGVPYALFTYIGLVPWTFFASALSQGGLSLISNLALLNKVYCPREVFPISSMITAGFDATVSTLVLVVLFAIYRYPPALATLWLPLLLAIMVVFTLGVTLVCSSVLVYLRDVRYVLPMVVQVGLFATPVAYSITFIPAGLRPAYAFVDPMAPILDSLRRTVLHGLPPEWSLLWIAALASCLWLVAGYFVFKRLETGIADIA